MKACLLLFTILAIHGLGQVMVGTVQKAGKDEVEVKARDGVVTFRVDEKTTVAKLKKSSNASVLAPGDEVRVNYYGEGTFTAVTISVKVTAAGVVSDMGSNHFKLLMPESKASWFVFLNVANRFAANRSPVAVGRKVNVTGWDTGDGVIEAEKVWGEEARSPDRPQR